MPSVITPIIDTAIGLVVVYITFSVLASWLGEQVSAILKLRGNLLEAAIIQLLSGHPATDTPASAAFFSNPIFTALKKNATSNPQYVSAQQFSSIFVGIVNPPTGAPADPAAPKPTDAQVLARIQQTAVAIGLGPQVNALIAKANGDYLAFIKAVEDWYEDHMDRVSGWYKQYAQRILMVIGFALALMWNVDSLRVVRALSCNAAVRSSVAALGDKQAATSQALIGSVIDAVPLGWTFGAGHAPELQLSCDVINDAGVAQQTADAQKAAAATTDPVAQAKLAKAQAAQFAGKLDYVTFSPTWLLMKIFGLVVTTVALSLGAPFWFDTLSKLTRVRQAGKKPDTGTNPSNA